VTPAAPVIVVGAGCAGLACAVRLASRGSSVVLLEQRPRAGGRCWSFRDAESGEMIDNGQHLLVAGYRRTLAFLETVGTRRLLAIQKTPGLLFHHPERGFHRLELPPLRAPMHLFAGVARYGMLGPADRLRLLRGGMALRSSSSRAAGGTVSAWLEEAGQSAETRRCFWDPLTIAVMNETPDRAAAEPFLRALRTAFLASPGGAALAVPQTGLSELFVDPAIAWLHEHGVPPRCQADVAAPVINGGRVTGVRLRDGTTIDGSAVVLAVPWHAAAALLDGTGILDPVWRDAEASVIVSVHLWYPEDFLPAEPVGIIGRTAQWVFNRRAVLRERGRGGHGSVVISAARGIVELSNEEIIARVGGDLQAVFGGAPLPARALVIREKRATPSLTPALEPLRPPHRTSYGNLFLAGDWTATGLPATIEGAIQSGEDCADLAAGA
jgi:hydroxysqualene dehydroxylase